ncbi:MAG: efflux RND transporter permease subunit [Bacteroidales bacterium]|nr:efflux RND transporter permease subunit [Bacteroidales bacterium]
MRTSNNNMVGELMRNHSVVFLLVGALAIAGIFGLMQMNKDEFPQFTIRQGVVVGVYPGAKTEEVEMQLAKPLENFLFTYPEVNKKKTYSFAQDGMVYIFVELEESVQNKNEIWSKIRHGLKDFKLTLPSGVLAVLVQDDFGNTSSVLVTIEAADKTQRELEQYLDQLCAQLRTIPTMGNMKISGVENEEIAVTIEPEKLASYGISSQTLLANLFTQGFITSSGSATVDEMIHPLHVSSTLKSESEVAEQIIYSDPSGHVVRLKDVATIERRYAEPSSYVNKDGARALVLSLEMRPGNNIVAFGEEVEKVMNKFQSTLPPSVHLYKISNQPKVVNDSVWSFLRDLVISILVVILVMLMLFPVRSALVAGSGIPICTAVSLALMYCFKIELNTVTLAALIMVLGMMVDNSIVMIDGYIEYINRGMSRWHAAIKSAKELFFPLLLATVAICGMFFPTKAIFTGVMGDFIKLFPITVTISLMISLVYAVAVVPYLEFQFIKPQNTLTKKNKVSQAQDRFFLALQNGFEKLLNFCFRRPKFTLLFGIGTVVVGILIFTTLNVQMMPKAERPCFAVEITLPIGSTLDETAAVSDSLQRILSKDRRVESITAFVGSSSPRFQATYAPNIPGSNYAQFIVNTTGNKATEELLQKYASYASHFPNAFVRFKQMDYQAVSCPIEVRFKGDDIEELKAEGDKVMDFMRQHPDYFTWVHSDFGGSRPYVDIKLRTDEATRLGITKGTVSTHLATTMGTSPLTTIREGDYSIPVKLYTNTTSGQGELSYEDVGNQLIPTSFGTWVPLRQIADITPGWEPARIVHRNGLRCLTVGADMPYGGSQPESMAKLQEFIDTEVTPNLPEDVELVYGGLTEINNELIPQLIAVVIAALVVIFLFLLFDFKRIPIAVLSLLACTLCFFGAFLGLKVFGLDFGITSVLGIVSLIGIIVRNSIIMFEYAEELRVKIGMSARDAAYEAGKRRMRPIFLTSATTALGVLPMIISRSTLWMPMGVIICFGTVFSIVLIVTVLPVAYWQIFKKSKTHVNPQLSMQL